MFFFDFIFFSNFIENKNVEFTINHIYISNTSNTHNILKISNIAENNKIGIVDFRYILKSSNAMKLLGKKFLTLEKEINQKIKQKQIYLKKKEENLKKNKANLTEIEYKKKVKSFKKEVFKIQKKY